MSNNIWKAAELYEKAGTFEKAADCYVRLNELKKAAELYEKAGTFEKAADCYVRLNEFEKAASLLEIINDFKGSAELYAKTGQFEKAGDILFKIDEIESLRYYHQGGILLDKLKSNDKYRENVNLAVEALEKAGLFKEGVFYLIDVMLDTKSRELLNTLRDLIARRSEEIDPEIAEYSIAFASYVVGDFEVLRNQIEILLEKTENKIREAKAIKEKIVLALSGLPLAGFLCNTSKNFDGISHLAGLINIAKLIEKPTPELLRWEIPVALAFNEDVSMYIDELSKYEEANAIANLYEELFSSKTPERIEAVLKSLHLLVVSSERSFGFNDKVSLREMLFSTEYFLPEILTERIIIYSLSSEQAAINEYLDLSKKVLQLIDERDWEKAYFTLKDMLNHFGYSLSSNEEKAQVLLLLALVSQKVSDSIPTAPEDFIECCEELKETFGIDGYAEVEKLSNKFDSD
ncbi:MAG: hypothetical protein QXE05_06565 [Nitrososphaeria archaeon]